jgi:hypothetical protein
MFEPTLTWLNQDVPLWAMLLATLTTPTMWSTYASRAVGALWERATGTRTQKNTRRAATVRNRQ